MKFNSWYRIEYGYFAKERFEGVLKEVEYRNLETKQSKVYQGSKGTKFEDTITKTNDKDVILSILDGICSKDIIDYRFTIENGVLYETIDVINDTKKHYTLTSYLNKRTQTIFLQDIFKMFGTYLALYITDHNDAINGQEYILNEFKELIEKNTSYTTSCGDYTIIKGKDKAVGNETYLGIDAEFERNTFNELDDRKGITLIIYMDDITKDPSEDNFIVNERTVTQFTIENEQTNICNSVLTALQTSDITFDLLYDGTVVNTDKSI